MAARTIAIGDVHGCDAALETVLEAAELRGDDTVVFLGDCIDRGTDSRAVVDRVRQLADVCRVVAILGNHEEMMLAAAKRTSAGSDWLMCGGAETLASYQVRRPVELPPSDLKFIASWVDYYETPTHFFAHGNYDASLPLADQPWDELRWQPLKWHCPDWHTSGKRAVLGHSAQKDGRIMELPQLVCIDTYCHGGGWLTAFCAESGQVWQADRDGRKRCTDG
jgi:serine/threonine protein phosphatase 1